MKKKLSEEQIDDIVISQADNTSEWEEAVYVRKTKPDSGGFASGLLDKVIQKKYIAREK